MTAHGSLEAQHVARFLDVWRRMRGVDNVIHEARAMIDGEQVTGVLRVDDLLSLVVESARVDMLRTAIEDVYRERNSVVAALLRSHGWLTARILDVEEGMGGWWIVYAETEQGQVSWHVPDRDMDLFAFVPIRPTYEWDGHSTPEKYERLKRLR